MSDDVAKTYSVPLQSEARLDSIPLPGGSANEYHKILAMTQRLFPGPVEVRVETDPEIADYNYLVFDVVAAGGFDDILCRDSRWHRELSEIAAQSPNVYCLAIDIQDEA